MVVVPENEGPLASNDAGFLEFGGDAVRGVSRAEHDECLTGGLDGSSGPRRAILLSPVQRSVLAREAFALYSRYDIHDRQT